MIKAPFNFVPLADKIYLPDWADQISQDVPFSDGVNGYIDLTIKALSPIFIRNGHTKEEAEQGKEAIKEAIEANKDNPDFTQAKKLPYNSFSKTPNGSYFIPATSIKGEIRSLLEILTYSKMRVDKSVKFAQREWYNDNLYPKQKIQKDLFCGYLKWDKQRNVYRIASHGKALRISHKMIDRYLKAKGIGNSIFEDHFSKESDFSLTKPIKQGDITYDPKTSRYKYHLVGNDDILVGVRFCKDDINSERLIYNPNGDIIGDIVLTGQPGKWVFPRPNKDKFIEENPDLHGRKLEDEFMKTVQRAGKFYEFVFPAETEDSFEMDEIDFNYFKFIYSESEEWPRVKELLMNNSKGVPVFFRKSEKKDNAGKTITRIKDFGLAYMYKLPYDYSPYDILERKYKAYSGHLDMAECLFGTIGSQKEGFAPSKGRIQFTSCISQNAEEYGPVTLVLNSPKASYYPIYIKQDGVGGIVSFNTYHTYNDGELSGWKRYVVRNNDNEGIWHNKTGDPKMDTTLFPLKSGTEFIGKVYFHNLRPIELGALLSALTFHSTDRCHHLLGQGKPYGFGKVKYNIELNCKERREAKEYFMALFERSISKKIVGWRNTPTIRSLFTLSGNEINADSDNFKYMKLSVNPNINEFQEAKTIKKATEETPAHNPEYLQDFISLQGGKSVIPNAIETYQIEIEKKAKDILESIEKNINSSIADIDAKIENNDFEGARSLLQKAIIHVKNAPEPILPSEVVSFIEELNSKEQVLAKKFNETEFRRLQAIYSSALSNKTLNAQQIIDQTIAQLREAKIEETKKWIEQLQEKKKQIESGLSDISTFLSEMKVHSINAFANKLSQRISPIRTDDIPFIVEKIKEDWNLLKSSERKVWLDRKKWGFMEKVVGSDITNVIFDSIKDLPIK